MVGGRSGWRWGLSSVFIKCSVSLSLSVSHPRPWPRITICLPRLGNEAIPMHGHVFAISPYYSSGMQFIKYSKATLRRMIRNRSLFGKERARQESPITNGLSQRCQGAGDSLRPPYHRGTVRKRSLSGVNEWSVLKCGCNI